jgi:cephalosporin hydroxylase
LSRARVDCYWQLWPKPGLRSGVSKQFMTSEIANTSRFIQAMNDDAEVRNLRRDLLQAMVKYRYSYNFTWMGRPIIQFPQDILAIQELVWTVKPDLIIETGIAHGGSLVFYASLLELIGGKGVVLGIDIDIRPHNRIRIDSHPMAKRIEMIEGSSIDDRVVKKVRERAAGCSPMVVLDSNHTHDHVLKELELYSPLVGKGSYMVVLDTVIDDLPDGSFPDRPWGKTDNPKTAVREFLSKNRRFVVDEALENTLMVSAAPQGYLKALED